jgi:2-polyprenyl-3-methyl-5-hydroxy-6-metoxy-1,4-benzoquinol methylase
MGLQSMKEIYDNYVEHSCGESSGPGQQAAFKIREFEYDYRKYFPTELESARILDIGVGCGEMLTCLKNWGYKNYLGIDISGSTIRFCHSLGLPCQRVENSTEYLAENPSSFDVITLLDVLEHIPKREIVPFLSAQRAALKPGGLAIIQVPNAQAPDGQLHRYNDITHEIGLLEHSFAQLLRTAGFEEFSLVGFESLVPGIRLLSLRKMLRKLHWFKVRFWRRVDGNLNPKILNPVFYAVARKTQ